MSPSGDRGRPVIVAGFDRTASSLSALRKAADLGRRLGASLIVVHAIDLADYPVDPDAGEWELQAKEVLSDERKSVATELAGYEPGWSFRSVRAPAADALVRVAEEENALMIVVGAREHGWKRLLDHLLAPPVGQQVAKRTTRPVLLVPEHGG